MGEEDAAAYNARVEAAFEARRIIAWPFAGAIAIEEVSKDQKLRELFVIDNWCLIASYNDTNDVSKKFRNHKNLLHTASTTTATRFCTAMW